MKILSFSSYIELFILSLWLELEYLGDSGISSLIDLSFWLTKDAGDHIDENTLVFALDDGNKGDDREDEISLSLVTDFFDRFRGSSSVKKWISC